MTYRIILVFFVIEYYTPNGTLNERARVHRHNFKKRVTYPMFLKSVKSEKFKFNFIKKKLCIVPCGFYKILVKN